MFDRWRKRREALRREVVPPAAPPDVARAGGEDGAGPAVAGPAEDEPAAQATPGSTAGGTTPDERARLVALYTSSGLTVREFAALHGVKYTTFRNWVHQRPARHRRDTRFAKRFTPEERRAAVEAYVKSGRTLSDFARLWGCSTSSMNKWLKRYREEGPKGLETRRPRKGRKPHHPRRLSEEVRALIARIRTEHEDFGVTRIADQLKRFHGIQVSPGTVRNVLHEKGIPLQPAPRQRRRPKTKPPRRFERARPGELWQSDITSYVLRRQARRVYLTVFLDDHSRYIVAWALATHQRTPLVTEPLLEGVARFGKPREVLTDQGRQYYAWRGKSAFQKLLVKEGIRHVVSRPHHPETLGKCERLWKTVGDEFWDRAGPEDLEDARRRLDLWIRHYNHFRPHQGIGGLVPADRFFDAEDTLRTSLEKELSGNELRLAIDEAPRKPVYLVGQIGEERIAMHGERGRLVIDTPDGGRRELTMDELGVNGVERTDQEESDGDAREQQGNAGIVESDHAEANAQGAQALGIQQGAEAGLAGARAVGGSAPGGEAGGARGVHEGPGVLAGQEDQGGDRERARGHAAAGLAAESEGAVGDDGGSVDAAPSQGGAGGLRARSGRDSGRAEEAHPGTRAAARGDRGPGPGAEDGPVAGPDSGVFSEGRDEEWSQGRQADDASQEKSGFTSQGCSGGRLSLARRAWRWLKRTE